MLYDSFSFKCFDQYDIVGNKSELIIIQFNDSFLYIIDSITDSLYFGHVIYNLKFSNCCNVCNS